MPVHDDLGTRMKTFYEQIPKTKLMRRTPVIIRIDGKAFHTFTRGFKRPFDEILIKTMQEEKESLSAECSRLQADLHDARSAAGKAENRAQQWVDKLSAYGDLYDAIQQCPSMSAFFKDSERLTAQTKEDALIQLVIMVGQTNAFAKDLYYYLREMKKNNNEYQIIVNNLSILD